MGIREDYQSIMYRELNEWKAQTERFKANMDKVGGEIKDATERLNSQFKK
jgi:hypothetical protein